MYADWLSEQDDPLGELIALDHADGPGDRRAMLRHVELCAALTAVPMREDLQLQWRLGFIEAVKLRRTRATTPALWPMLEQLLDARCGAFVRSLDVELGQFGETSGRFLAAISALGRPPLLERLVLRSAAPADETAVRAAFPALKVLELVDGTALHLVSAGPAQVSIAEGGRLRLDPLSRTTAGRSDGCDLVLFHEGISRKSFQIEFREGRWLFEGLGGVRPIAVNGKVTRGQHVLHHGDRLEPLAGLILRFVDPP